jgi:hypothetical protein
MVSTAGSKPMAGHCWIWVRLTSLRCRRKKNGLENRFTVKLEGPPPDSKFTVPSECEILLGVSTFVYHRYITHQLGKTAANAVYIEYDLAF